MKTMWPDRRLIDVLQIEHPIVLSPMASFGTVDRRRSRLCRRRRSRFDRLALGWNSEFAAKTIRALRALTDKLINVRLLLSCPGKDSD